MSADVSELQRRARVLRARLVQLSHDNRIPHLGSGMSCMDVLVAAYFGGLRLRPELARDPDRDRFVLSKGHAAAALYVTLAEAGFLDERHVAALGHDGALLAEHPPPHGVDGVEAATGSLGHGLGLACGMALGCRLQGRAPRIVVLMSDGEMNEGSVWEAAMFAAHHRLGNVLGVVDANGWQATGRTGDVLDLSPLVDKWRAFGWDAEAIDGHALDVLVERLGAAPAERPRMLIARTVKGRGVSFMEDDNNWHYRVPNDEELAAALAELEPA